MQIPTLGGLFDPVPYKAPEDAIERNLRTLGALQDPRGTLETLQSDKVIKQMADLKTEGIGNLYSEKALQAIKGFQDYSMSLYKSRKGFNRLSLSAEQQLDEKNKYRDLLFDINALKELTKTYNETMQEVARDVRAGIMTPENYREFEKLLDKKIASAKTIRDQPDARAVYNNFLTEKRIKPGAGIYKSAEQWADLVNKPQTGETIDKYDLKKTQDQVLQQMNSGEYQQNTRPLLIQQGVINPGMTPTEELTAATQYAQNRFNPSENRKGVTNIYPPGYDKTYKSQYLLQDNKITFKSGTGGNLLVGRTLTDTKGDEISAGVLFEPNYIETRPDGTTVAIGVVTEKVSGDTRAVRDEVTGNFYYPDSSGTKRRTVEIPYDQIRNDIVIGYGRAIGEGEFDFSKAEKYINYKPGTKTKPVVTPKEKAKFTGRTYDLQGTEYTAEELFDAGWTAAGFSEAVRTGKLKIYRQKK